MRSIRKEFYIRGYMVPLCVASWFVYYSIIPRAFEISTLFGVALAVFPGVYIGVGAIYLMHECWHEYFSGIDNKRWFKILCALLFTQPAAYNFGHVSHHKDVNTYEDREIHPIGKIESRLVRILYNVLSIVFGSAVLLFLGLGNINDKDDVDGALSTSRGLAISLLGWMVAWGSTILTARLLFNVSFSNIAISYLISFWFSSFCHRHNELIEHGDVIAEGGISFRSRQTRNLLPKSIAEKFFLFLVHQDSREHTLHHTTPSVYTRPFMGDYRMPEGTVSISLGEYLSILRRMVRGDLPETIRSDRPSE